MPFQQESFETVQCGQTSGQVIGFKPVAVDRKHAAFTGDFPEALGKCHGRPEFNFKRQNIGGHGVAPARVEPMIQPYPKPVPPPSEDFVTASALGCAKERKSQTNSKNEDLLISSFLPCVFSAFRYFWKARRLAFVLSCFWGHTVLSINASSNDAFKRYFRDQLTRSDYYMKNETEVVGQWQGRGAALLDLSGPIQQDQWYRLCDGKDPHTGEQLTARLNEVRRATYDFTFDAPKAVSVLYEVGRDERIHEAFRESVRETMTELENDMRVRVRIGGQSTDRISANVIWGEFTHRTTRPLADGLPDPQLHIHAVAANVSFDPVENRWKAGEFGAIKRDAWYYQAAFHSRLGAKLTQLGHRVERDRKSFRIAGIDRAVVEKYSRRSKVIDAEAERLNITDAAAKSQLGRRTRRGKGEEPSIESLRAKWRERVTPEELAAIERAKEAGPGPQVSADASITHSVEHCFERESVVSEKYLLTEALMHGVGSVRPEEAKAALDRAEVLRQQEDGIQYVTTKNVLREELQTINYVREARGTCCRLGADIPASSSLSAEQRRAANAILRSRDGVIGLRGRAGTGKTTMMKETVKAIKANGHRVYAFAPTSQASRGVLRKEGFANAETVQRLLVDEKMQKEAAGQVLLVDEAGLLSSPQMNKLIRVAKANRNRLLLVGDTTQHSGVARGESLSLLEKEAGLKTAELTEVRRQTNDEYRKAVQEISEGDAVGKDGRTQLEAGITRLDSIGAIVECDDDERFGRIAADYLAVTGEHKKDGTAKSCLIVSPTHAEADKVTAEVRSGLKKRGDLKGGDRALTQLDNTNWTTAQRRVASNYVAGMKIQYVQNAKGIKRGEQLMVVEEKGGAVTARKANGKAVAVDLNDAERFQVYQVGTIGVATGETIRITQNGFAMKTGPNAPKRLDNGSIYTVAGFTNAGDIKLANGAVVSKDWGQIDYGYTSTSHSAQGKTTDVVLISMGQESMAATNREQFYVSVSRGREAVRLYTDDRENILAAVKRSGARRSATELMKAQSKPESGRLAQIIQVNRIRDGYARLRERVGSLWTRGREGASYGRA